MVQNNKNKELLSNKIYEAAQILKLKKHATMEEIKKSYRHLIKKWHPDKCNENPEICKNKTEEIVSAYKTIMEYCQNYRYSFEKDDIINNLPADKRAKENFIRQFGEGPLWE